jgi:Alginate export
MHRSQAGGGRMKRRAWTCVAVSSLLAAGTLPGQQNKDSGLPREKLPKWLKIGGEARGRLEAERGFKYVPGKDDTYYLQRLSFNVSVRPISWLSFSAQVQDCRVAGYSRRPLPPTVADPFDLRSGFVEVGRGSADGWSLRAGRQEMRFGEDRLIGNGNWNNVPRRFDAVRLTWKRQNARLDWFASSVVVNLKDDFDRPRLYNGFFGFYSSFRNLPGKSTVEPYLLWKTNSRVRGEFGTFGDLDVYTAGARAVGELPLRFDYSVEVALQAGSYAADDIRAWAGHWLLGHKLPYANKVFRLVLEFNHASGDGNPRDGRHGTFDQLFPTNHQKYGIADRITWRNMNDLMAGVEWRPAKKWRWQIDYHSFWLATLQDGMYTDAGVLIVRNPSASSRRIGDEVDVQGTYQFTEHLQFGAGIGHLFAGPFLRESIPERSSSYPYVMWTYVF